MSGPIVIGTSSWAGPGPGLGEERHPRGLPARDRLDAPRAAERMRELLGQPLPA